MKLFCEKCKKDFTVNREEAGNETACPGCGAAIAVPESNVAPGVVLGDFLIEKVIASGGMGVVYLARQISLDRHVALKVLQNKYTGDKDYVESLYREARAAAKISHPNVVQAYAIGEEDGVFYFAMEYVRGDTFKSILKEKGGKLEFEQAARVIRDVARALSAAWKEQKLVHQDIKPDNIMLDANGFAKLADLGLAKSASMQDDGEDADEVLGTPQYISPEQLTGVPTDIRSDIYSLGATFYQFVTGRYAYVADSLDQLPRMHVDGNLEPPKSVNPELPDELNAIIVKMMARMPENRYQDADALIADLDKFLVSLKAPAARAAVPSLNVRKAAPAVPQLKLGGLGNKSNAATGIKPAAAPAVKAPLTLNLGGAKKPVAPAAPPAAAKPVAPAAPPAAAKPVAPAAPPAAAKPVAPAAPPAAAKPVAPAAPPAAAKPVAPAAHPAAAKPVAPAAPPAAAKPVAPAAPPAAAKPVAPAAPPAAAKPVAVSGAEAVADPIDKTEKRKTKFNFKLNLNLEKAGMIFGKSAKWFFIVCAIVLFLGAALSVTVMILAKKDRLPKWLAPVNEYVSSGVSKAKNKAIELSKAPEMVEEAPKGPVTRPEYLAKVEELTAFRRSNPQMRMEFLKQVDEVYEMLRNPVTDEEKKAYENFLSGFSSTDEQFRCMDARNKLRNKFFEEVDAKIAEREKAEAERKRQDELKARQAAEAEQRVREIEERNKREQQEFVKRIKELKAQCFSRGEKLAKVMLDTAISGDRSAFDEVKLEVEEFIMVTVALTVEEKAIFDQLKKFCVNLEKELKNIQAYKQQLAKVNADDNIYITLDKRVYILNRIADGKLWCKAQGVVYERPVAFHEMPGVVRQRLYKRLKMSHPKLNNPDFFVSLLNRHVDATALKDMPSKGFWKDYWAYFAKEIQKK